MPKEVSSISKDSAPESRLAPVAAEVAAAPEQSNDFKSLIQNNSLIYDLFIRFCDISETTFKLISESLN